MKLQLSLLAASATANTVAKKRVTRPDKPKAKASGEKYGYKTGPATIHCDSQPGSTYWNDPDSTAVTTVAQTDTGGMFGSVSISDYVNDLHCYVDFAEQCDEQGVDINFTTIDVEDSMQDYSYTYDGNTYYYDYEPCMYDQFKLGYTDASGDVQYTDHNCGCHNCPENDNIAWYDLEGPSQYSLVGTDLKFVLSTDESVRGGNVEFNWQCRSYGNDICPSKFDGSEASGCYTQSSAWQPGKDVSCSMDNAACMTTTCSASGINSFFRGDLFHVNSKHQGTFMEQLQAGIRVLKRKDTGAVLVQNDPCGYTVNGDGVEINWNYADCGVAPSMKNGKIAYGVGIQAFGNDADSDETIEFYVDFAATAECLYDPEIDIDADGFFINQEDVEASTSDEGSLFKNFKCLFFEDEHAKNQIKEHNIVNMGERIYGRVRSKNGGGHGLIYKLQRVTFTDASGKITPAPSFHVIGGGNGGQGSTIVKAAVQKSKHVPKKPYWRSVGKNMKFSFLSFGFENLSDQNEVDIKCRIKIDIDPTMFPDAALGGEGTRTLSGEPEYDYSDSSSWGSLDYYDEDY